MTDRELLARISELEEENRQLVRALREAIDPPTFMGEPVAVGTKVPEAAPENAEIG